MTANDPERSYCNPPFLEVLGLEGLTLAFETSNFLIV